MTKTYQIREDNNIKQIRSRDYNYNFDKNTGYFERWGKTINDDPSRCEFGPEIADIEITSICKGPAGKLCSFCYKSNNSNGHNMSIDEFKIIFDKISNGVLTQIAFGADAQATANPDLFKMMEYARHNGVIPNITVADIDDKEADQIAKLCGAVAVSFYPHAGKDICYNSIARLAERGMDQINIHFMLDKVQAEFVDELIYDIKHDPRLISLNAVVFLSLKNKGRGINNTRLTDEEYKVVVNKMFDSEIGFGFDSCSAAKFLKAIEDRKDTKELMELVDPCESTSFSLYINEKGYVVPCSFMEGIAWKMDGFDYVHSDGWNMITNNIQNSSDFLEKVWNSKEFLTFGAEASRCVSCGNGCQIYNI